MSIVPPPAGSLADRLVKLRSAADSVERLAAEYHDTLRPVREVLQAVADAPFEKRDRWAGAVSALARRLAEVGMSDMPAMARDCERWTRKFDGREPGRALAGQAFCSALAATVLDGTSPVTFFSTLDQNSFISNREAADEICRMLSWLMQTCTERTAPRFDANYSSILCEAGEKRDSVRERLAQIGVALSSEAAAAIGDWDECQMGMMFRGVSIRPSVGAAQPTDAGHLPASVEAQLNEPEKEGEALRREQQAEEPPAPRPEVSEYARFLELHALATSPETHGVSLAVMEEYQRLLAKHGVFTVEGIFVGPPNPGRAPRFDRILNTDCIPIAGNTARVCPRSSPKLPPELLPGVERRFRELQLVGPGYAVLWVGRQANMESLCMFEHGCTCFAPETPPDDGAFRPAKEMLSERFGTYKALRAALRENEWIRHRRPRKNRLEIHAGDWSRFLALQPADPLDSPAELVDAVVEAQQRMKEIRQKKGGK